MIDLGTYFKSDTLAFDVEKIEAGEKLNIIYRTLEISLVYTSIF